MKWDGGYNYNIIGKSLSCLDSAHSTHVYRPTG
jgi:hypothetical protein